MRRLRNVKIVATLGPASSDHETIRALFEAGADVFRLNMSHGAHDDIRARHGIIRRIEAGPGDGRGSRGGADQRSGTGTGTPRQTFEVHMLYGIRPREQASLVAQGYRVATLISYGEAWYRWYMRRLAERPANLWFVVKSLAG